MAWGGATLLLVATSSAPLGAGAATPPPPLDCAAAGAALRAQQNQVRDAAPRLAVLILGEIHTSAADHAWQLDTLERLSRGARPLALGLEMVPAARQAVLTDYATGTLDGPGFLARVDWPAIWGHDPELYAPLLRWARRERVPLLALNVEPEVVRRTRRQGLEAIPAAEREGIGPPAPATAAYRQRLRAAWQAHRAGDAEDLERFIASQLLRDRAMAERLAAAHRRDPARLVVALIGRGHLEDNDGVPRQLRHLGIEPVLALVRPEPPEGCGPAPSGARLGAFLDSADGAVWVRQVAPGSAGARAGLRPGDRLLSVNGEPVRRAGQVIRRVRDLEPGAPLRLSIERDGQRRELDVRLPTVDPVGPPGRMGDRQPADRSASP